MLGANSFISIYSVYALFHGKRVSYSVLECASEACEKESLRLTYTDEKYNIVAMRIVPKSSAKHFEHIPPHIKQDYDEACLILEDSPNASATLARRCLDSMISDFHGIKERDLYAAIQKLKKLSEPEEICKALDGLRSLGNLGAHGDSDHLLSDVTRSEAEHLTRLLELLFRRWYIARAEEKKILDEASTFANPKG